MWPKNCSLPQSFHFWPYWTNCSSPDKACPPPARPLLPMATELHISLRWPLERFFGPWWAPLPCSFSILSQHLPKYSWLHYFGLHHCVCKCLEEDYALLVYNTRQCSCHNVSIEYMFVKDLHESIFLFGAMGTIGKVKPDTEGHCVICTIMQCGHSAVVRKP